MLVTFYHADGLGSIVAMTDDQARNVQQYEYDSFGNQHDMKNRIKQPYGYTGREHDRETGLRYYRARYYDGEVGRFISEDPIGFAGEDFNLYAYVWSNPILYIDPWGLAGLRTSRETLRQRAENRPPWPIALESKYPIYSKNPTKITAELVDCYAQFLIGTGIGKGVEIELLKIFHKQGKRFIPGINYLMTANDLYRLNKCLEEQCEN